MVNIHVDIALRETLFREVDIYKTNGRRKGTSKHISSKYELGEKKGGDDGTAIRG